MSMMIKTSNVMGVSFPSSLIHYICIVDCDYILHAACANLLKKIRHPSSSRQLTLHAGSIENLFEDDQGPFKFTLCKVRCSGFAYVDGLFKIDVRCASIYDGYVHESQPHSMLVVSENRLLSTCSICHKLHKDVWSVAGCDGLYMCYGCATIPQVAMHKYDVHPLSLRFGEKANGDYWCEICEKRVDPHNWFYTHDECCTTLHVDCVRGKEPYLRVGSTFMFEKRELVVVLNKNNSRPHCRYCYSRRRPIQGAFVCNFPDDYFCSFWCLYGFAGLLQN